MLQQIKLVIEQNGQLLDAINESTATNPSQLLNSLQNVQKRTNEILTKMVESSNKQLVPGQKEEDVYEENASESDGEDNIRTKKRKV